MLNFDWATTISDGWAKFIVLMAFVAPMIFALSMKKSYIFAGAVDKAWWRNLKIWVVLIVAVQVGIYLFF